MDKKIGDLSLMLLAAWCHWWRVCVCVCVCHANSGLALSSDGKVLTKVQMKDGGSQGHKQTVMKQQCDLQLAGPIVAEQRSPHETVTTLKKLRFYCPSKYRTPRLRVYGAQEAPLFYPGEQGCLWCCLERWRNLALFTEFDNTDWLWQEESDWAKYSFCMHKRLFFWLFNLDLIIFAIRKGTYINNSQDVNLFYLHKYTHSC